MQDPLAQSTKCNNTSKITKRQNLANNYNVIRKFNGEWRISTKLTHKKDFKIPKARIFSKQQECYMRNIKKLALNSHIDTTYKMELIK